MTEAKDIQPIDDELNTTAPQGKPDAWIMPAPVFRKTSGKLPQGFVKDAESGEVPASSRAAAAIEVPPTTPDVVVPPQIKPKSPILKILLVVLGLAAMVAFIVVFLTVIYFYFFYGDAPAS
jgi:hypothetical protein